MTSRERVRAAIRHQAPDRIPVDMGATAVTGMHAKTVSLLRHALGLHEQPICIHEVFQQLGFFDMDLVDALGIDVIGLQGYKNFIGVKNESYVPYQNPWGIQALISADFAYNRSADGALHAYPAGERDAKPSMKFLPEGYFFHQLSRGSLAAEEAHDGRGDFSSDFAVMTDEEALFYEKQVNTLHTETDKGIIGLLAPAGFGDAALIPATGLPVTPGVRDLEEWMMAHLLAPEYIHDIFAYQTDIALQNLARYRQAVGDKIDIIYMGGTDFGTQTALMMSRDVFREFYAPHWRKVNDWVHLNTPWKTFYHSCGAVEPLIEDFIAAGADILNPVQCSACGMEPHALKERYGDRLVFWGGGIDTQKTLPFGTPQACYDMTLERLSIFGENGGYVFNAVHNIQGNSPIENVMAMFQAVKDFNANLVK